MVGDRVSDWTLHKLGWRAPHKQRHVQLYDDGMGGWWAKVGGCWMQPSGRHLHMWNSVRRTLNFIILFYCGKYYCLCYLIFVKDIINSNILIRSLWYLKIYNDINIVYMYKKWCCTIAVVPNICIRHLTKHFAKVAIFKIYFFCSCRLIKQNRTRFNMLNKKI